MPLLSQTTPLGRGREQFIFSIQLLLNQQGRTCLDLIHFSRDLEGIGLQDGELSCCIQRLLLHQSRLGFGLGGKVDNADPVGA